MISAPHAQMAWSMHAQLDRMSSTSTAPDVPSPAHVHPGVEGALVHLTVLLPRTRQLCTQGQGGRQLWCGLRAQRTAAVRGKRQVLEQASFAPSRVACFERPECTDAQAVPQGSTTAHPAAGTAPCRAQWQSRRSERPPGRHEGAPGQQKPLQQPPPPHRLRNGERGAVAGGPSVGWGVCAAGAG